MVMTITNYIQDITEGPNMRIITTVAIIIAIRPSNKTRMCSVSTNGTSEATPDAAFVPLLMVKGYNLLHELS